MVRALTVVLAALVGLLASPALAKPHLFEDQAPLTIVLTGPLSDLVHNDRYNLKPYPATMTVTDGDAAPLTLNIQLTARGLTRRTAGFCSFPPLWLDFDKEAVKATLFKGQKKLKLVTYCKDLPDYEQRIILEYLAYKLYNVITPMSFRVRAAEVTYRSSATDKGVTRFGFLLEGPGDVAGRNDRDKLTALTHQVVPGQLDRHAAAEAAVFEFMIGNLDWEFLAASAGAECCHNSRLLAAHDATPVTAAQVVPVPYDFDYSGLVDSPYAAPPVGLPLEKTTERYYRGYCVSTAEVPAVLQEYQAHKAELLAVISNDPRLAAGFRDKALRYLGDFFTLLDDPAKVQRLITGHCR